MMEEATAGRSESSAWLCAVKSRGVSSAAACGTGGPQRARNSRTRASFPELRAGGGSGAHRLIWNGAADSPRTVSTHSRICDGLKSSAPHAPMPPP